MAKSPIPSVESCLSELQDPRRPALLQFHQTHRPSIEAAWGSKAKHQAWPGGYLDHIGETFRIAQALYSGLHQLRSLPFALDAAMIVLYFHDVEKIWKYTTGLPADFDKERFWFHTLATDYGIEFTAPEANALRYIHGEPASLHNPDTRVMEPLGAFCHSVDTLSARLWPEEGRGLGGGS